MWGQHSPGLLAQPFASSCHMEDWKHLDNQQHVDAEAPGPNLAKSGALSLCGDPIDTTAPAPPDFSVIYTLFGTFTTEVSAPAASQPGDYFTQGGGGCWVGSTKLLLDRGWFQHLPNGLIFFLQWKAGFWGFSGKNKVLSWGAWVVWELDIGDLLKKI